MWARVLFSQKAVARPHRSLDKHLFILGGGGQGRGGVRKEGRPACGVGHFQLKREQDVQLRERHPSACCPHPSRAPRSSFPDGSLQSFTETPSQWEPHLEQGSGGAPRDAEPRVPLPGGEGGRPCQSRPAGIGSAGVAS